tara:strand:- start:136 stop:402 length:267 start_codon:yes stop_codon:yes gene_type:complete
MKRITKLILAILILAAIFLSKTAYAEPPHKNQRAKFYDFSDQIIDGEIKRPTALYTDSRQKVKFNRLLKLKKSFLPELLKTAKEEVFK